MDANYIRKKKLPLAISMRIMIYINAGTDIFITQQNNKENMMNVNHSFLYYILLMFYYLFV